jgi:CRISPR-associated protein Cmr3
MDVIELQAQDTLFFRDSRPFNQEDGSVFVPSLFPPAPHTVVGALRSAWAMASGWDGRGPWGETLRQRLGGDGDSMEHGLRFYGPLVALDRKPVFPVPAMLLGKAGEPQDLVRLRPLDKGVHCDLGGSVRLPHPLDRPPEGLDALSEWWLTSQGMAQALAFQRPARGEFVHQDTLFAREPRVGNALDADTRTTEDQALYALEHIRPQDKTGLLMGVDNAPVPLPGSVHVNLGGEARYCWLSSKSQSLPLPPAAQLKQTGPITRYAIHVLTPLDPIQKPEPAGALCGLPGRIVSICMPRVQRWGGWDSSENRPRVARPHLAPGSVVFMEADAGEASNIKKFHGKTIGGRSHWGFGLVAIGAWE